MMQIRGKIRLLMAIAWCCSCVAVADAQGLCPSDLDGDGRVGGGDVSLLLLDWGDCPSTESGPEPVITTVSPPRGPVSGGTTLTITGTAFSNAAAVRIGSGYGTGLAIVSDTMLTVVAPAGVSGPVNVSVVTLSGTTTISGAFAFQTSASWCSVLEELPDPAVVTDATTRATLIATGLPWRVRDKSTAIEMVLIPSGTFTMGRSTGTADASSNPNEIPTHQVKISKAFYVGRTEVTQAQWVSRMGSNPSAFPSDLSRPVEQVSFDNAQQFCAAAGLRLLTEAEWEFACRGGTSTARYGSVSLIAWSSNDSGYQSQPVATKVANAYGLYDTLGNVWEWCQDWYGTYTSTSSVDPVGPPFGTGRLIRGGGWNDIPNWCTASVRYSYPPSGKSNDLGFRVARNP